MTVVYEDNHLIIVNKAAGEIVQGDKTGDATLADSVKAYIKERYAKPGAVFLGVVHRLDRPVSGLVVFARTSKALARLNALFREGRVRKTYLAVVGREPSPAAATLTHWLTRNERLNKSFVHAAEVPGSKRAVLEPLIITLAPFAPHMAEELYHALGNETSVLDAAFPAYDEKYLVEATKKYPISFNGKVRFSLDFPADWDKDEVEKAALAHEQTQKYLDGKAVKKVIVVPGKIVNIVL